MTRDGRCRDTGVLLPNIAIPGGQGGKVEIWGKNTKVVSVIVIWTMNLRSKTLFMI